MWKWNKEQMKEIYSILRAQSEIQVRNKDVYHGTSYNTKQ